MSTETSQTPLVLQFQKVLGTITLELGNPSIPTISQGKFWFWEIRIYFLDGGKNHKISQTSPSRSPWARGFHGAVSLSSGSERQPRVMKWISKIRDSSGIRYPLAGPLQTPQICFFTRPCIAGLFLCWHLALTICYFHTLITKALITSWGIEIDLCLVDLPSFSAGIFPSALLPVSYDGRARSEETQSLFFFFFFWCRL